MSRPVRIAETPPRFPLEVQSVESVGEGVYCVHLEKHPMPWKPGDCVTLFAPGDDAGRPYSFSGSPEESGTEFWVRNIPDGRVSSFLTGCKPGTIVEVSPPFGWFHPGEPEGGPKLFVATGTGIAPFLSTLKTWPGSEEVSVLWGMREELDVPACLKGVSLLRCVSQESVDGTSRGRVTNLLSEVDLTPEHQVYLCGLDAMIEEATCILLGKGVPGAHIHKEVFFTQNHS